MAKDGVGVGSLVGGELFDEMRRAVKPGNVSYGGQRLTDGEQALIALAQEFIQGKGKAFHTFALAAGASYTVPAGIVISRMIVSVWSPTGNTADVIEMFLNASGEPPSGTLPNFRFAADNIPTILPWAGTPELFYVRAPAANSGVVNVSITLFSYGG